MAVCAASPNAGLVERITEAVDCNIRVLVHDSYRALVGPDTWFATAFTGLLTIYIALIGYQLLLGRGGLRVTALPLSALKIGLVMAFLTSWAAYQTVVFNLLFEGPRELVQALLRPMQASGAGFDGDVNTGVERTFDVLSRAAALYGGQASPNANILQGGPMLGSGLLWLFSMLLLLITVGLTVATKIVLAFLLAVGPLFVGLLLFEPTRGLFDGWLRTTIAFALAPAAISVFTAAFLMIIDPFLVLLEADMAKRAFDMGSVITIGLILAVFTIVMVLGLGAVAGVSKGLDTRGSRLREPSMMRLPAPDAPPTQAPGPRAERMAAQAAFSEMNQGVSDRFDRGPVRDRAAGVIAAAELPTTTSDRLGQAYSRAPRPTLRKDERT